VNKIVNSHSPYPGKESQTLKFQQKMDFRSKEDDKEKKDYLKIWKINPSFKDINNKISLIKTTSLLFLILLMIISTFILIQNLIISISTGIIFTLIFIFVFHEEFFMSRNFFSFLNKKLMKFNPFKNLVFWYNDNERSTLFITNRKDLNNLTLNVFKVEVIPENVHSSMSQFLRTLSSKDIRISYTYQVVQKPFIEINTETKDSVSSLNTLGSINTTILFTIFYDIKGILTRQKIDRLNYYIKQFSNNLRSALVDNFHHFKVKLLSDLDLINTVRTYYVKNDSDLELNLDKKDALRRSDTNGLFKLVFCIVTILFLDYFLFFIKFSALIVIGINFILTLLFITIYWRAVFFQSTRSKLLREDKIVIVDPFKGVDFYYVKKIPYSLFLHIDHEILLGIKILNLKYIFNSPFCLLGRFFEAINNHKVFYAYTLENKPLNYYDFYNNGLKHLYNNMRRQLLYGNKAIKSEIDGEKWLGFRSGMWYSTLNITVIDYKFIKKLQLDDFITFEEELESKAEILRGAFNMNFQSYELVSLKTTNLISGFLFSITKSRDFRLNGSHLNYVMLQGSTLVSLTTVEDVLKKGIETKIGSEFNTPLQLRNFVTIGYTINTEVNEREIPVGFTREQLKNLLIVNGASFNRLLVSMKIVSELVKTRVPSLIFDFDGRWSNLLDYFKGTRFEEELLVFKLGSAFTVDPLISDIPYDQDNTGYLEYMFDAYSLAFKKDERTIDMFRNTIRRNPEMDLPSIQLELQTQNDWEKNAISESLISLFSDFTEQDLTFFQSISGYSKERIRAYDFVKNNKTTIVDLSSLRDLKKQHFFTFLILSKIIHYIKNSQDYNEKIIIIPHTDIFFDSYHLDKKLNYGKINMFLEPLIQNGFGFIFCANQIHNLHNNLFTYFNNIITFKTTEMRDVAILSNLMNLQELEGRGYYSRSRNQTYQIQYLKNLKNNEVLIRREDIYQTFPAVIEWDQVKYKEKLPYEEVITHMENQGYNLKATERKILAQAKKTIFEKDFGHYIVYLKEIIKFLDEIKTLDQIGNLYKQKLKNELKEIIYPNVSQKTNKKDQIKKVRDDLFNILVKHGYLVENHPKRASGSETLRTSYSVGNQYQKALEDYFKTRGINPSGIKVNLSEEIGDENFNILQEKPRKYVIEQTKLRHAFAREFSDFNYEIFRLYSFIKNDDFANALKLEHNLIKNYLFNVYKQYYNGNYIITSQDINEFCDFLSITNDFPFNQEEISNYLEKNQIQNLNTEDIESQTKEIYQFIYDFFIRIQQYIYQE